MLRSQSKIDPQYANKKMKFNTINKMMLLIGVLLLLASGCGTFFHPGSSKGFQVISSEYSLDDRHIVISVHFNGPVKVNTVVVGKTLLLNTEKTYTASGEVTWSPDYKRLTFRTHKTIPELMENKNFFKLTLIGTESYVGQGVVKDQAGKILDGNADGKLGGNYTYQQIIPHS